MGSLVLMFLLLEMLHTGDFRSMSWMLHFAIGNKYTCIMLYWSVFIIDAQWHKKTGQ